MTAPALRDLESLMDAAWPAPDRSESNGWVLRAAEGVTQRANSVWPREPGSDPHAQYAALREARLWYRDRRLPLIFQLFDDPRTAGLHSVLDAGGFTRQSETLVMWHNAGAKPASADSAVPHPLVPESHAPESGVELSTEPSPEWLELWWQVDGRGGPAELAAARGILTGCPSVFALVRSDDGVPAAVGRLALPAEKPAVPVHTSAAPGGAAGGWGGLYCMATRPDARRRGHARGILQALLNEGAARQLAGYWLLVTAANSGAQQLYAAAGFSEAGRYLYRQDRPKRHLTGC
ncbi:GNAT family N-acetyltransferase [Pseudarthrobacter sulfonivorans]|uniref:GNAT family N-acetyltransferase n=1 Tax=Pseudarthrobacter sulfonivorans TaxID=121292 RepID=UPI0028605ED9|nr:GNAT family N-acetyltransferase [Pseudarthrobacter sulfonivorans]MDR6415858.1 ribosomal protein S18 acetylase RimI-like enzyme [Pseudarthrobacter sulfonivorans]